MNMMNQPHDTVELPLPRQVSPDVASDIQKESVYVSPFLERITVSPDGTNAILQITDPSRTEEVIDKAHRYLEAMCKHISGFEVNVTFRTNRQDKGPYLPNVHQRLVQAGWVHDYGEGQVAYSGPVLALARCVSETAASLYKQVFDVHEAHFPAFVSHETLTRCGYVESHPTTVNFVANMTEDFDALEAYRLANSCADTSNMPPPDHMTHAGTCLNPAACLPAYPTLQDRVIGQEGHVMSWLGRVFRYESRNVSGLDRLYEFNVREMVFVGSEDFVVDKRETSLPLIRELAERLDLDMTMQSATDPFFATVSAAKKFFQQAHDVKSEILLHTLDDEAQPKLLAGGSVNLHGTFFGERFNITTEDGALAHTGCIGLGIERWIAAAFTQHGLDPDRWPANLKGEVFA